MTCDSQIVIGPDGTVLAATGELPPVSSTSLSRIARTCRVRSVTPGSLSSTNCARSGNRVLVQSVALDGGGRSVQLVAIEALAIRRAPTDMRTLLTSKLAVITSQAAAADVTLSVVVADDVPAVVHVDSEKVAWAVTTLVGNALRYVRSGSRRMPGGRSVCSRRSIRKLAADHRGAGRWPGIPADTVTRLFKRDGLNVRGAGLALLLMSDICAAHGGTIDVRSSIDASEHGTTVRLTFPR